MLDESAQSKLKDKVTSKSLALQAPKVKVELRKLVIEQWEEVAPNQYLSLNESHERTIRRYVKNLELVVKEAEVLRLERSAREQRNAAAHYARQSKATVISGVSAKAGLRIAARSFVIVMHVRRCFKTTRQCANDYKGYFKMHCTSKAMRIG